MHVVSAWSFDQNKRISYPSEKLPSKWLFLCRAYRVCILAQISKKKFANHLISA
jgi:hypothetical protein